MKFKRHLKLEHGLQQITLAPLINVIFLLLIFFMFSSSFISQSGIHVKLPKAVTSDTITEENFIITISGENVIYWNTAVLTLRELEDKLRDFAKNNRPVLIKADSRASMGRIVDVWDICRKLGIERINIATNRREP